MTDAEYRYVFHWGLTLGGGFLLLLWAWVLMYLEKRDKDRNPKTQ